MKNVFKKVLVVVMASMLVTSVFAADEVAAPAKAPMHKKSMKKHHHKKKMKKHHAKKTAQAKPAAEQKTAAATPAPAANKAPQQG
ncbi:MAG: hypothetical protein A3E82_02180 [Gammaproteobacteria bacterium RIFCSPHIGHO2_12_FULL_38_11]|nr:MAG: hypothetical protein A3E82_02180 [Gammaproteobacteria bacterium RIFCSPHIGHO2_12_FULL_38_11]